MRIFFFSMTSLISLILTNVVSPNMPIFGVQLDFLLLAMFSVVFFENSMAAIWYFVIGIAMMDVFFARTYGFYAFQYLMAAIFFHLITKDRKKNLMLYETGISSGFMIKELAGIIACFLSDNPVSFFGRLIHYSLKGVLEHVLLGFIVFFIFRKIYEVRAIRPTNLEVE